MNKLGLLLADMKDGEFYALFFIFLATVIILFVYLIIALPKLVFAMIGLGMLYWAYSLYKRYKKYEV